MPPTSGSRGMIRRAFTLDSAACTHVGRIRQSNEDAYLLTRDLVAVADGLGGHKAGDVASATAVEVLHASRLEADPESFRRAFAEAHWAVQRRALEVGKVDETSTTLCALVLDPAGRVVLANVGDSRIYRYSAQRLEQVTWDHIWANEFINDGMRPSQARRIRDAEKLSRVIGAFPEPCEVDTWTFDAVDGDRYLLASDGLTRHVPDEDIEAMLASGAEPESVAAELVEAANDRGGLDNITTIVADVTARVRRGLA